MKFPIVILIFFWIVALFVTIRILIPALIMMQNDGALIIAFLLPVGFAIGSYYSYRIIKENIA